MFERFFLSSAAEKPTPLKNVFPNSKMAKLPIETCFDHDCKNLHVERLLAFEKFPQILLLKIDLVLAAAD